MWNEGDRNLSSMRDFNFKPSTLSPEKLLRASLITHITFPGFLYYNKGLLLLVDCFKFSTKLSPCRKRLLNLLKSAHPVRHLPWCRVDGSYNPMQCYGSYCYCVYENGNEQPGTKISVVVGRPVCTYTSKRWLYIFVFSCV